LLNNRNPTIQGVLNFLGVDESFDNPNFDKEYHKSNNKRKLNRVGKPIYKFLENQITSKYFQRDQKWILANLLLNTPKSDPKLKYLFIRFFQFWLSKPIPIPKLDSLLREEIVGELSEDVEKLRGYLNNPIEHWQI